ncbi:MAG: T9SS type A sorting domain-containing protein [Bacteroidota bacterium]
MLKKLLGLHPVVWILLPSLFATYIFTIIGKSPEKTEYNSKHISKWDIPFDRKFRKSLSTPDDPNGRANFDLLRMKDPITGMIPLDIRNKELAFASRQAANNRGRATRALPNFSFVQRGPFNVGGRTRAAALDISDPGFNTILAGGVSGGMWRSTDGGDSWVRTTRTDQFPSVVSLMQDTRSGRQNTWYYGTGEIRGNSADGNGGAFYRGDGIYKSTNGGQSWAVIPSTSTGDITTTDNPVRYVNSMAIDVTNTSQDEVYAAVIDGIIRSTNGFDTYEFVLGTPDNISLFTEVAITSTGRVYATISDDNGNNDDIGIWTSSNGINWQEIEVPTGVPTRRYERTTIGISPSNENIVYFLRTDGDDHYLMRYNAANGSIENRSSALPAQGGEVGDFTTQGSYDQFVTVHPDNSDIVYLGGANLWRSTNGFSNENATDWIGGYSEFRNDNGGLGLYNNHHPDQHAVIFYPNDSRRMLSVHDGGVSRTENNRRQVTSDVRDENNRKVDEVTVIWDDLNSGYLTTQFYAIGMEENTAGDPILVGGMQDNSTFAVFGGDTQEDWIDLFGGDGAFCEITYNSILVSAQVGQMGRYAFEEESGEFIGFSSISPPEGGDGPFLFINPFLADPIQPNKVFVAGREVIYYTLDIRDNPEEEEWLTMGENALQGAGNVSAFAAATQIAHRLYVGTSSGRIFRIEDSNRPDVFTDITASNLPSGYVNNLAVDPRNGDHVFAVYSNYGVLSVFESTDGGERWTPVSGNLEENPDGSGTGPSIRWMEILPNGEGNIYLLGTSVGLYATEELNGMNTVWEQVGENSLGNVVVDMIEVRPVDGTVTVGTHGNGVYQAQVETPLYANIFMTSLPCGNNQIQLLGNQADDAANVNFQYEWLVNGTATNVTSPGLITNGQASRVQLRLRDLLSGQTALSNFIDIQYIYDDFCEGGNITTSNEAQIVFSEEVKVYPNPSRGEVTVELTELFSRGADFSLRDLQGRLLQRQEVPPGNEVKLDLSAYPAGTYVLSLQKDNNRVVKRIIRAD